MAQTVGCVNCGVTLIIVENLALAADQQSKIISANGLYGPVLAYQLDSIQRKDLVSKLKSKLEGLEPGGTTTVFLYTSPRMSITRTMENADGQVDRQTHS